MNDDLRPRMTDKDMHENGLQDEVKGIWPMDARMNLGVIAMSNDSRVVRDKLDQAVKAMRDQKGGCSALGLLSLIRRCRRQAGDPELNGTPESFLAAAAYVAICESLERQQ